MPVDRLSLLRDAGLSTGEISLYERLVLRSPVQGGNALAVRLASESNAHRDHLSIPGPVIEDSPVQTEPRKVQRFSTIHKSLDSE